MSLFLFEGLIVSRGRSSLIDNAVGKIWWTIDNNIRWGKLHFRSIFYHFFRRRNWIGTEFLVTWVACHSTRRFWQIKLIVWLEFFIREDMKRFRRKIKKVHRRWTWSLIGLFLLLLSLNILFNSITLWLWNVIIFNHLRD